ncbi:MAG: hypothetical protein LBQ36_07380 [Synergistaceae bacterium]|jgi:hypothetical protein|nr:hypothetical protein [Synergistaceae bacterium]
MDLLQNPFNRINGRAHHNRRKLTELADAQGLSGDPEDASGALSELTHPRKRLFAEIAWLPGVAATQIDPLLSLLDPVSPRLPRNRTLPSADMARANLLASGLSRLDKGDCKPSSVAVWILEISRAFDFTDPETLMIMINEERVVSGFPEVTSLAAVREAVNERRRYFRGVIMSALNGMPIRERVEAIAAVVGVSTNNGRIQAPIVVFDMVDLYEVESKSLIAGIERTAGAASARIMEAVAQNRSDADTAGLIDEFVESCRALRRITDPISVCARVRGLGGEGSVCAKMASELEAHLNALGRPGLASRLSDGLMAHGEGPAETGGEAGESEAQDSAGSASEENDAPPNFDDIVLGEGEKTREQASESDDKGGAPIEIKTDPFGTAYEARGDTIFESDIETVATERISISPKWIEWKGRKWDVDAISRVRWGRVPDPSGDVHNVAQYRVFWGYDYDGVSVDFINSRTYDKLAKSLWKAVGSKLMDRILAGMRDGGSYRFGETAANDLGIELERHTQQSRDERVFCRWADIVIMDEPGVFSLGMKDDNELWVDFKYLEDDNINILENAVRARAKRGTDRLSGALPA